ncbi:hypothetical protein B0H17DRAFT_1143981 [Mycena rosella]|uniref:WD40 repeat-like protein n=1 Tax=Mycena rosella TaxID=1033263 RepID=A0AAD7CUP3_MYCRO|nr:hypothetical protein B0H17DRAFT_1143981 [Mycena rosella]
MALSRLPYVWHRGVSKHPGSVLSLAATEDGTILASGGKGSQGTRLWNISDMSTIARPSTVSNRGATLVVIWAHQADELYDVLYAGTQNGYFFCWRQRDGAISKDPQTGKWIATNIFTRRFPKLAPQAITFAAFDNSQDRDIMVFGLHNNGPICTIRGKTGEIASQWSVGAKIGDAAFNWRDGVFCLDNPTSGPTLFRVSDQMKAKMYAIHRERTYGRTRKVRFREQGSIVISGSDHGCVYIFDTRSGEKLQTLSVGASEWVRVVETTEIGGVSVIFAAQTRALDFSEEIFVWKRSRRDTSIGWSKMFEAVKALIFLGCIAFLYQNLEARIRVLRKAMNM